MSAQEKDQGIVEGRDETPAKDNEHEGSSATVASSKDIDMATVVKQLHSSDEMSKSWNLRKRTSFRVGE